MEDIEVIGAVMYVGDDPAGAQTSGVFGGSENVKGYIDDNHVNIRKMLSDYTTVLRWVFVPNQSHILSQLSLVITICKENPTQLRVGICTGMGNPHGSRVRVP
jgi:hypothetical protein